MGAWDEVSWAVEVEVDGDRAGALGEIWGRRRRGKSCLLVGIDMYRNGL